MRAGQQCGGWSGQPHESHDMTPPVLVSSQVGTVGTVGPARPHACCGHKTAPSEHAADHLGTPHPMHAASHLCVPQTIRARRMQACRIPSGHATFMGDASGGVTHSPRLSPGRPAAFTGGTYIVPGLWLVGASWPQHGNQTLCFHCPRKPPPAGQGSRCLRQPGRITPQAAQ